MAFARTLAATAAGLALTLAGVGAVTGAAEAAPSTAAGVTPAVTPAVASQGFTAVAPTRILDSRTDPTFHKLSAAASGDLTVTGVAAVPSTGVSAVVLNVTAIARTAATYVTVYPTGGTRPTASNLNLRQGMTRANQVIAQVGAGGEVTIYNNAGNTDVIVDITGYLATGSSYTGQTPARIIDTRSPRATLAAHGIKTVQVTGHGGVPAGVTSVVLNLTGLSTTQGGYLTVYPTGTTRPVTSNLNLSTNQTSAVLVVAKLSAAGQVSVYSNGGPTNFILDVAGWFTGTGDYASLNPVRLLDSRLTAGAATYNVDYEMQITGKGGVPANAGAVALSVTSVDPTQASGGYVVVHPGGTKVPGTSNISAPVGRSTPNLVIVQLSPTGTISIFNHAEGGAVLVDVEGWIKTNTALSAPNAGVVPGVVTQPYDYQLQAPGGLAPYTWATTTGTLPDGLSLSSGDGTLSGTPTTPTAGTTVKITVSDSSGESQTQSITFTVSPFSSRTLWGWGGSGSGVLGSGAPAGSAATAVALSGISGFHKAAVGGNTAYGIASDNTLWAWGKGAAGQLGDGSTSASVTTPVQVSGLSNVQDVESGGHGDTAYALLADGTLWAWGKGSSGLLGNGSTTATQATPVQVSLTNVIAIATAPTTTYAVKSDGTVWAWGSGGGGQIGNGLKVSENSPVQVTGLTGITEVAGGYQVGYALKSDGTVWSWGSGATGQLGNGTTTAVQATAVKVTGLSTVTDIASGYGAAYAVNGDGTVSAWGTGAGGAVGNGSVANATTPVLVSGLTNVTQVAGGDIEAYALDNNRQVWAWGTNTLRSLGLGAFNHPTTQVVTTPQRVLVPPVTSIAANHSANTVIGVGPN